MTSELRKFATRLFLLSLILAMLQFVAGFFLPEDFINPAWPFMILFFVLINYGMFYYMVKATQKRFSRFVNYFMIMTMAKLFLLLLIIILYALLNPAEVWSFVITFFIYYMVYTIFEVAYFLRYIEANKNHDQ